MCLAQLQITFYLSKKYTNPQVNQYRQFNISHEGSDFSFDAGGNYCSDREERGRCAAKNISFNFNIILDKKCSKGRCAAEDIADNIGLKLAYNALQHFRGQRDQKEKENCLPDLPFNANQLFWVNNWKDRAKDQIV